MRCSLVVLVTLWGFGSLLPASEWAEKMFQTTKYNFGTMARGSKPEVAFELSNIYKQTVHIAAVRSSCGCTIPQIVNPTLEPLEQGKIVCMFDTVSHLGQKKSVVTVTFDKPFSTEVQLIINGYVRRDLVMKPGTVDFRVVDHGRPAEQTIQLDYAGRVDWEIIDVRSTNDYYEVDLIETYRDENRTSYVMHVRLKESAPVGYLRDQLTLITNDPKRGTIPLPVEGRVREIISLSPKSLSFGQVLPGTKIPKKIVVRSKRPFRIVEVTCDDDCFVFKTPSDHKKTHVIPVTFVAIGQPRRVTKRIQIETDLENGTVMECLATATVTTPEN